MIFPTLAAIPLTWWYDHKRQHHLSSLAAQTAAEIDRERFPPQEFNIEAFAIGCTNMTDTTPLWIKKLLGVSTNYYPRWLRHNNRANVCNGLPGEAAEQQWNYVKRLRYLDTVYIQGPPTRSNLERLTELSCLGRLKTVSIQFRDYHFQYDRTVKN